jgi:hypothetical protein
MFSDNRQARLTGKAPRSWFGKILAVVTTGVLVLLGLTFSVVLLTVGAIGGLLAWAFVRWKLRQIRKQVEAQLAAAQAQGGPFAAGMAAEAGEEREVRIIEGEVIRDADERPPLR